MAFRATVSIGNYNFPEPTEYNGTTSTFVDSARNTQGYVVGAVIRDDVAKVEMKWAFLTPQEWSDTLKVFSPEHGGSFYNDVTFYNQVTNDWTTRKMYVSDRKAGVFLRDSITGVFDGQRNCSLSLVEV